jgi:hypothetical protein
LAMSSCAAISLARAMASSSLRLFSRSVASACFCSVMSYTTAIK